MPRYSEQSASFTTCAILLFSAAEARCPSSLDYSDLLECCCKFAMLEQHLIKQCALKAFIKWMAGRQQKQSTSKCAPSMGSTQLC